jgi:hypothetical protein
MFRKFKLVPIDGEAEPEHPKNIAEIEKALREYNPTTRAMANLYGGIQDALFSKNKKNCTKQKKISANERLHLVAANRMRMHRLLQGSNEPQTQLQGTSGERADDEGASGGLVEEKTAVDVPGKKEMEMEVEEQETGKAKTEKAKAKAKKDEEEEEEEEEKEEKDEQIFGENRRSNMAIPKRHDSKFTQLAGKISGTIGSNRLGEVIIRGGTLRNTSYSDVMRALYVDYKFTTPGLVETVAELKRLGVKMSLFTSRKAKQLYSAPASDKVFSQQKGSGGGGGGGGGVIRHKAVFPRILRLY